MAAPPLPDPFRLGVDDIAAWVNARGLRRRFGQPPDWLWYGLGAANLALGAYACFGLGVRQGVLSWLPFAVGAFAMAAPAMNQGYCWLVLRRNPGRGHDIGIGWGEAALEFRYGGVEDDLPYAQIVRVDERPEHILLWLDTWRAVIVPKRAFASGRDADRFAEALRDEVSGTRPGGS
ncbi:YcxB family protein [Aureimonas sp. ME7]|uniref:YcxB family protein n=1 Tax=Aureimonas sp. ME7 TaxID=2744252 RepID=UPI0015F44255|nr:YcxB family protein [Aureimonas sp. ME7]